MTEGNGQFDQSIFRGTERIMQGLPKVAAAIVGLSGVAYVIGWTYARAYFDVFGANWLKGELPILTLLSYSWWPIIILLFYTYLGITDLAEAGTIEQIKNSARLKQSRFVLNYGRWIFIILAIADVTAGECGYPLVAQIISSFSIILVFGMAISALELLAYRLSQPSLKIELHVIQLTYLIIAFGLYFAPTQMGHNAALGDKSANRSSLPLVMIRNDTTEYRLLLSSGDRFYIVPNQYDTRYPPIRIVNMLDIEAIKKKEQK